MDTAILSGPCWACPVYADAKSEMCKLLFLWGLLCTCAAKPDSKQTKNSTNLRPAAATPPHASYLTCQTIALQTLASYLQVGHLEHFDALQEQLQQGHNVVLLANHQTEADPGVWALLLEKTHPQLATDIIYVAGDRYCMLPAHEGVQCSLRAMPAGFWQGQLRALARAQHRCSLQRMPVTTVLH